MKGKVTEVTVKRQDSGRYEVSVNVVLKRGLTCKKSEQTLSKIRTELLGKTVELWPILTDSTNQR